MVNVGKLEWYAAVLIGLFLVLAFYVGFVSDSATLGGIANGLTLTFQGRNAQGQLAGYPSGGKVVTG